MERRISMHQRLTCFFLVIAGMLISDGLLQSAAAQCGPEYKIYIPPQFVPPKTHITEQVIHNLIANPAADPKIRDLAVSLYMRQNKPTEIPYKGGRVLINPKNPCDQFYIPN